MKKMLSIILSMVILLLPLVVSVSAESLSEDFYEYSIVDGNAVIIDVSYDIAGDITVPSTLGGYTVKHIGVSAFSFRSDITSISLPDTIETIGASAFAYCDFKTFTMPDSVVSVGDYAFENCDKLESIYISKNATHLGEETFYACRKLKEINIPKSVVSIGRAAFFYCYNLTSINVDKNNANYSSVDGVLFNKQQTKLLQYPAGKTNTAYAILNTVTVVGEYAFFEAGKLKSINIPNSVNKLEYAAFSWCYNLTDIVIPNSVTEMGDYVLSGCTRLTSVKLPDGITTINNGMFYECRALAKFEVPNTVTTIGYYAFAECDELAEIKIPNSVTKIDECAFKNNGLRKITIPSSVTSLGKEMLYGTQITDITVEPGNKNYISINGVLFNKDKTVLIQYPVGRTDDTYIVPNGVKTINEWAFYNCAYIKQIVLPQGLEKIGGYAFAVCTRLEDINIPDSVISVGECLIDLSAYYNDASNWENGVLYIGNHLIYTKNSISGDFTVKEGIKTIAAHAFYWRYNVENIIIPDSVVGIGELAFGDNYSLKSVKIPASVICIGENIVGDSPNAVLTVYENSYAKDYAVANEIPYNEIKLLELENKDVKLVYYEDILSGEVTLDVTTLQLADKNNEKKITTYNINLQKEGFALQPNKQITVYLPISDEINAKKCGVGYIDENGNIVKVGAFFNEGYMTFDTDVLGTYAVFEKTYISGDVNSDEKINNKDLTLLMQKINQWNVEIDLLASDVNADGIINNKDFTLLMQYINKWKVYLK